MLTLVTGASGFIGAALVDALASAGEQVRAAYRTLPDADRAPAAEAVAVGDVGGKTDWTAALAGVGAVIHLASPAHARAADVHVREATVAGAAALAEQALAAGVERFIYVSSIKACAARSRGRALREEDHAAPEDVYGRAKREAELLLLSEPALRPVVIRPPLVFAPDAKANFALLLRLAASPLPLPLGAISNRRSLISRPTLVAALKAVLRGRGGDAKIFHVADQPAVSTTDLITALRRGMGQAAPLFPMPGIQSLAPRALVENLEVDDGAFRNVFGYGAEQAHTLQLLENCAREWKQR
ncbi:MAG: NAD-dependent epimerase/dehydratase family protein [Hyphomonadaceae bacterium]